MAPSRSPFGFHLSSRPPACSCLAYHVQNPPNWSQIPAPSLLHPWGYIHCWRLVYSLSVVLFFAFIKKDPNFGARPVFKEPCASLRPLDLPLSSLLHPRSLKPTSPGHALLAVSPTLPAPGGLVVLLQGRFSIRFHCRPPHPLWASLPPPPLPRGRGGGTCSLSR